MITESKTKITGLGYDDILTIKVNNKQIFSLIISVRDYYVARPDQLTYYLYVDVTPEYLNEGYITEDIQNILREDEIMGEWYTSGFIEDKMKAKLKYQKELEEYKQLRKIE